MIQFFKEIYLTAFSILFKIPGGNTKGKIAGAVTLITLIEWLILAGIASWIDIFTGTRFLLSDANSLISSKLIVVVLLLALGSVNNRVLVTRGHGIKFEREFNNLKKSRKNLLIASCVTLSLTAIAFFIRSRLAYRHFFQINS